MVLLEFHAISTSNNAADITMEAPDNIYCIIAWHSRSSNVIWHHKYSICCMVTWCSQSSMQ